MASTNIYQVIDGSGEFESAAVQEFVESTDLAACRTNYQVVAIMGPQSSGKSTLLNHVFGTNFTMMDAMTGRGQTTKGIWLCKSPKVTETTVLVMDLEGSDGRERGEDDTNFERQSALFALAVADVLLVNIWCHDIGREHGSGKPLLKTIFQVNLKLFAPDPNRKRTVLLFVIRDKTKTPLAKLVEVLQADLDRMWDSITKPAAYQNSKMTDFFDVQFAALSHFEERYEDFLADTVVLRRRFAPDAEDTLLRGDEKLPGDTFSLSVRNIWDVIRQQKDLNLPAHKVMVANIRCAEIMEDQLRALAADQAWAGLKEAAATGCVEGFGAQAGQLLDSCMKGYEAEAMYFDLHVREAKHVELTDRLLALLQPVYAAQVAAQQAAVLSQFERELRLALSEGAAGGSFAGAASGCRQQADKAFAAAFDKHLRIPGTPWDGTAEKAALAAALADHISRVRSERIAATVARAEKAMAQLISGPVIGLLESCAPGMWPRLHGVCRDAAGAAEKQLMQQLNGYELSADEVEALSSGLRAKARAGMQNHVREAALTRLSRMKDRFQEVFSLDDKKSPRMWSSWDDVPAIAQRARLAAAGVLSALAVLRPPPGQQGAAAVEAACEVVEAAVVSLAKSDGAAAAPADAAAAEDQPGTSGADGAAAAALRQLDSRAGGDGGDGAAAAALDVLSAATWPGVEEDDVLLHPHDVRTTWREFVSYSNVLVQQAQSAQQSNRLANNRLPPLWALLAMLVLGWNEAMTLLFSPLYLILGVLGFLFFRSLYTELDVDRDMSNGPLPAAISIGRKFVPAVKEVVRKTRESATRLVHTLGEHRATAEESEPLLGTRSSNPRTARGEVEFTDLRRVESKKEQ